MECQTKRNATPRVVVLGLASCFGCQLQITNAESHLLEILGQIDVQYWQMASSAPEPEGDVDVVIIEGAVSTVESREIVERWRKRAKCLIAMGACAVCGGIPSIAAHHWMSARKACMAMHSLPPAEKCLFLSRSAAWSMSISKFAHVLLIPPISLR